MQHYKPLIVFLILFCLGMVEYGYAQAPVITPKPQPVVLHLDPAGYYKVNPNDIAIITNTTDSATHIKVVPASFDCSNKGHRTDTLTAYDNGTPPPPASAAANVGLNGPISVAFDPQGNMYVSENFGRYIRKITPDGKVTKFAGSGEAGYADGLGTNASFGSPQGIVADTLGNLYLLDSGSTQIGAYPSIRKITPEGLVTTIYSGTYLKLPYDITIDKKGTLYISDEGNNNVDILKAGDKFPTTLAGTGARGYVNGPKNVAEFNGPSGIAVDDAGNVYVAENPNNVIRKITPDGTVSTFAGTGHSKDLNDPDINTFLIPYDVKISKEGFFYISDYVHIIRISPDGKNKTVFCNDPRMNGILMTFDQCENIYLADINGNSIEKVTSSGVFSVIAGNGSASEVDGDIGPFTCQIAIQPIKVNVESQPTITTPFNDVTLSDCSNLADYTIKATATDNCPGAIIKFTQTPAANIPLDNNQTVNVTVTATDTTGGTASTSFNVKVQYTGSPPGTSVSVTASTAQVCQGQSVTFNADVINGEPGQSYQWLVNGVNTGPDDKVFTTSDLKDGDIVNCAVTTAGGCGIPNTGLDAKVSVGPYPTVTLNPAEQIFSGNSVQFNPTFTGNPVSYTWTPATGLDDPNSPNPTASPVATTTYQVKAVTDLGCDAEGSVTVTVINQIKIPNTFTPNGDGINDIWEIPFLSNYTNCEVNIYNRYGSLIFHSIGYGTPWNGTYNGKRVPVGEYYYIVDLRNGSKVQSGDLTVLR